MVLYCARSTEETEIDALDEDGSYAVDVYKRQDYTYKPEPPVYFFQGDHIDKFTYSPPECAKHIETVFA